QGRAGGFRGGMGGGMGPGGDAAKYGAFAPPAGGAPAPPAQAYQRALGTALAARMDLGASVATAAAASQLGDFFQYLIDKPVTLPRQKSALLPIVGKDVEGTRVSIYNERTQAKFRCWA